MPLAERGQANQMSWFDAFLASLGGGVVIAGALLAFLGKLIAARVTESIKTEYAGRIEELRHQLQLFRDSTVRFDAEQFRSYGDLWAALYDLRHAADRLWDQASNENFQSFGLSLLEAQRMIGRKRLLLEPRHAQQLDRLVDAMWELRVGKERLIDLRRRNEPVAHFEIRRAVDRNREWVERYRGLIADIEPDFREQIRGNGGVAVANGT